MSKKISNNLPFIQLVTTTSKEQRKALLKTSDDQRQIESLCEIIYNVVNNPSLVPSSKRYLNKIKQHKDILIKVSKQKQTYHKRKKILLQTVSFLPQVLRPILNLLQYSVLGQHGNGIRVGTKKAVRTRDEEQQ